MPIASDATLECTAILFNCFSVTFCSNKHFLIVVEYRHFTAWRYASPVRYMLSSCVSICHKSHFYQNG